MDNKINSYKTVMNMLQFLQQIPQRYIPLLASMAKEFYIFNLH